MLTESCGAAGIKRFYVHDDYSTEPMLDALLDKVALGIVHYWYWASPSVHVHGRQVDVYGQCLALHGHQHKVGSAYVMQLYHCDSHFCVRN